MALKGICDKWKALARQTVYAMARNLACRWGKNSWQLVWGFVGMRVVRAGRGENFKMFTPRYALARIHTWAPWVWGTTKTALRKSTYIYLYLCQSIVAPSLLIVYELFTKWYESGTTISSWQVVTPCKKFEHFKIISTTWHAPFHLTRIPTHPHAHCHEFFPHWHEKLRALA